MREALLLAGDEFEQGSAAILVLPAGAQDRIADLAGVFDALAPPAKIAPDIGVVAPEIAGAIAIMRQLHRVGLDRHRRIIQHDGRDRNPAARGGLKIEAGHAKGGVAHEIDAELVGGGDFGADHEPEPGAELVRFAPTEIATRPGCAIERIELLARAA